MFTPHPGIVNRKNYCRDRCYEATIEGQPSYAPCPFFDDRCFRNETFCHHCGWIILEHRDDRGVDYARYDRSLNTYLSERKKKE